MQEILQKFEGTLYMSSLDLNSAYLQIGLDENSRQYTAFLFETTVYQYKRVPYGFRNSLSAFIRAMKLTLGAEMDAYVVFYVDDILIYSKSFEEHVTHLDTVLNKLTKAGFTLNIKKCQFCRKEIKFLGHIINKSGVSTDPERVEAIRNYPVPQNRKQLRQFLGICNFHSRFIVGYVNYAASLYPLLKQDSNWEWNSEKQEAFQTLRKCFAKSIQLVYPNEEKPYAIYTDASKLGVSAILTQEDKGKMSIVSTASRVLTETERKYTTSEQELLAVVYALQKFRIFVIGHSVIIYSDNKALTFLKKCNLNSGRITRWVMQLQEYDLTINHIKGTENFFADTLSRNPTNLSKEERHVLKGAQEILVAKVDIYNDQTLKEELKRLEFHHSNDPVLRSIKEKLKEDTIKFQDKYMIREHILYCKNQHNYPYWRIMLPPSLEHQVIKYTHYTPGHQGTSKCLPHISQSFYVKNIGRKLRKFIACCDECQKTKHPNRTYESELLSHLPKSPSELVALHFYGPLPIGRGGVKYLLVCLEVFSKHVTLYPLKSATTRSCLNKLVNHYISKKQTCKSLFLESSTSTNSSTNYINRPRITIYE
jgi:hypothetical protein